MNAGAIVPSDPSTAAGRIDAREGAIVCGLVLLAAGLRAYRIELPGLSSDEAFSWRLSTYPFAELLARARGENAPPLYAVLLRAWSLLLGDAPLALRGLSLACGAASVPLAHALVRRALGAVPGAAAAAVAAAALVALHAGQVTQARNARMYAMGVLLTALSGLLLLRCLEQPSRVGPWLVYGAAAATFLYLHYYAAFTLVAQGAFAAGDAVARARRGQTRVTWTLRGLGLAAAVAFLLYLPWLPVLLLQSQRLDQVPAGSLRWTALAEWVTGFRSPSRAAFVSALAGLAALAALAVRGGRAARFFALQAALPWLLGLAWSAASGRSVLRDRYLAFAQFSLLCLLGTLLAADRRRLRRDLMLAGALIVCGAGLLLQGNRLYPDRPHALARAARFIARERQPGDLVLADSPRTLNKLVYYMRRLGIVEPSPRCPLELVDWDREDRTHLAALGGGEMLAGIPPPGPEAARLWRVLTRGDGGEATRPGWRRTFERDFDGGESSACTVWLWEPAAAVRPGAPD